MSGLKLGQLMSRLPDLLLNKFCQIFLELWVFANLVISNLSARFLEKYLSWGLETSEKILSFFSGVMAVCKFGHFKLVSKISR